MEYIEKLYYLYIIIYIYINYIIYTLDILLYI